jgi:DNA invertase Pin-like site-specific DNA recombinase
VKRIRELRAQGMGMIAIARKLKCGGGTVQRALKEDAGQDAEVVTGGRSSVGRGLSRPGLGAQVRQ